ncbi:reverse transcriptase domain-containing protein [Citrus sinensis]|uniref:Reverse transcriptase domain-containing protein n=1 Tax=Citrus sinensis TaxID=2711 RepID=A0ACB8MEM0_CITSI|nr:reverse transcriptase domain-containing protein [Citrus sinensis]
MARINGIQAALGRYSSRGLVQLEARLWNELETVMGQKEILWWQKSRKDELLHGDRNTNFFHQKTIARRRRNRIEAIQDTSGNWLYSEEEIRNYAIGYFSSLYKSEVATSQSYQVPNLFPVLNAYDLESTAVSVLDDEIKRVIFSMKPLKAPVVHSMRKKTGKKWFMAIKVDLEKVYDRLNWSFIFNTLQQTGIPIQLSRLVMECVTSARMSILWNGEATAEFIPGRGICQGDPLSPYIFVLCIERLSHGITQAVRDGSWKPIPLAKHGTPLTHLFFADDLLLFAEASIDQAYTIDAILDNFCRSSEAKVHKSKTKIYFSKNVVSREAQLLNNVLGYSATNDLGCYLGMPLIHSRVNRATYQSILEKVDKRLTSWNAAHLSFASRITLAHSVPQAMPIYAMQTTILPAPVRGKLEKSCRRFIWDGKSKSHKMSIVGWNKICMPKPKGGLGFKKLDVMNQALLMKLSWGVVSNSDKLWVKVICSKYGSDPRHLPLSLPEKQGSGIWKAIKSTWSAIMQGAPWAVCDGSRTRFWLDCWATKQGPLINLAVHPVPQELVNATVSAFLNVHGGWN